MSEKRIDNRDLPITDRRNEEVVRGSQAAVAGAHVDRRKETRRSSASSSGNGSPPVTDVTPRMIANRGKDTAWLAKGSLLTLNGSLIGRVLQTVTQVAMARLLGPAVFGLYAIGWAIFRVSNVFTTFGLDNGAIHCATRYLRSDPDRAGRVLGSSLVLAMLLAVVVSLGTCLAAPALAYQVFRKPELLPVIYLFAMGFPLAAGLRVASASTTVSQSMKYSVYSELLVQPFANLAFFAAFYWVGWRLLGSVTASVLSFGVGLILAFSLERRIFSHFSIGKMSGKRSHLPELVKFSAMAWLGIVFTNLIPWVDRLFTGAYLTPVEVGIYQSAAQASVLLGIITGAFNTAVAPRISYLFQRGEMERVNEIFHIASKWVLYANAPLFLVFVFTPGLVLHVLFGPSYASGVPPLIVLSVTRLVDALVGPLGILLIFTSHPRMFSWISAAGLLFTIALNYLLIPRLGALGAALGVAFAEAIMVIVLLFAVRLTLGIWPQDKRWLKGFAAGIASAILLWIVQPMAVNPPMLGLLLTLGLSSAVFFGSLVLFGLDKEDRELLRTVKSGLVALAHGA